MTHPILLPLLQSPFLHLSFHQLLQSLLEPLDQQTTVVINNTSDT